MKVLVTIKELNSDFKKDYADEYHGGKESENNLKSNWETGFSIDGEVTEINLMDSTSFALRGHTGEEDFDYQIPDMQVLECTTDNGKSTFAISNKLINKTHQAQNKKYKRTHYYFYLKDNEEAIKVSDSIIIAKADFPDNLLRKL